MKLQSKEWYRRNFLNKNKMENWIDINDRLPEPMTCVLCSLENGAVFCFTYTAYGFALQLTALEAPKENPITHWMPLPKPPVKCPKK